MHLRTVIVCLILLLAWPGTAAPERTLTGTWNHTGFSFESTGPTGNRTDVVLFTYDAAAVRLGVRVQDGSGESLGGGLSLGALREFQDLDGNGAYDLGDLQVQHIRFQDMRQGPVRVVAADGGYTATVDFLRPGTFQRIVTLEVRLVDGPPTVGPLQDPMRMAWTLNVDGFPFETDNRTMLALEMRWDRPFTIAERALSARSDHWRLTHTWDGHVDVEGAPTPVETTVQTYARGGDRETLLLIAMPRAGSLEHDGSAGFAPIPADDGTLPGQILDSIVGSWPLYLFGLVAVGTLVVVPIVRRLQEDP